MVKIAGKKEMALPLDKKRKLPTWMKHMAAAGPLPEKKKPVPRVSAVAKRTGLLYSLHAVTVECCPNVIQLSELKLLGLSLKLNLQILEMLKDSSSAKKKRDRNLL